MPLHESKAANPGDLFVRFGLGRYTTLPQEIARVMSELRDKDIIAPVYHKVDGYRRLDHSTHGHVARYCICHDIRGAREA